MVNELPLYITEVCWSYFPLLGSAITQPGWRDLMVSVAGALAGACGGALGAGWISKKSGAREQLLKEAREVNAALVLAMETTNMALSMKKHHIQDLVETYQTQLSVVKDMPASLVQEAGLTCDLRQLLKVSPPISELTDIVLRRLSATAASIACVIRLEEAINHLNFALSKRNELIEALKTDALPQGATRTHIFFGIPYGNGMRNEEYAHLIESISLYTNDVIFFGSTLCESLMEHGNLLISKLRKSSRFRVIPTIAEVDFSSAQDLMPDAKDYESWSSGIRVRESDQSSHWWRRSQ